jgi:2-oxoglutarate ferredoxin oxidoreductase subunit alpha
VQLAEHLQTVSLVLSDQSLGQSQAIIEAPPEKHMPWGRIVEGAPDADYRRYRITADNISPVTLPGTPDGMYTADGLEHNELGTPSSMAGDHRQQLNKRLHKLQAFDYGDDWWHQVSVLSIAKPIPNGHYPQVTERVGASPPRYMDE